MHEGDPQEPQPLAPELQGILPQVARLVGKFDLTYGGNICVGFGGGASLEAELRLGADVQAVWEQATGAEGSAGFDDAFDALRTEIAAQGGPLAVLKAHEQQQRR